MLLYLQMNLLENGQIWKQEHREELAAGRKNLSDLFHETRGEVIALISYSDVIMQLIEFMFEPLKLLIDQIFKQWKCALIVFVFSFNSQKNLNIFSLLFCFLKKGKF